MNIFSLPALPTLRLHSKNTISMFIRFCLLLLFLVLFYSYGSSNFYYMLVRLVVFVATAAAVVQKLTIKLGYLQNNNFFTSEARKKYNQSSSYMTFLLSLTWKVLLLGSSLAINVHSACCMLGYVICWCQVCLGNNNEPLKFGWIYDYIFTSWSSWWFVVTVLRSGSLLTVDKLDKGQRVTCHV